MSKPQLTAKFLELLCQKFRQLIISAFNVEAAAAFYCVFGLLLQPKRLSADHVMIGSIEAFYETYRRIFIGIAFFKGVKKLRER